MIYAIDHADWTGTQYVIDAGWIAPNAMWVADANTGELLWTAPPQTFTKRLHLTFPDHPRLVIQDGRDPVADIDRGRPR